MMRNAEILGIVRAFDINRDSELKLPVAVSWKRRQNYKVLADAAKLIDEALGDISKKYADDTHSTEDDKGQRIVNPEYREEYAREQTDLLNQETDVKILKVSIEEVGNITLSDKDMDTLMFMIGE